MDTITTLTPLESDTICAISTPPGVGGIAVARVSGPDAIAAVQRIWRGKPLESMPSHTAALGTVADTAGNPLDQCVATVFRAPASFTGQDTVEIAVHGSRFIQQELIASLIGAGCRLAEPGEFTRRAFSSGKMDLAQAEAVADMIASSSRAAHRIAITQMRGGYSRRLASLREKLLELASLLELELDFSEEDVEFASRTTLRQLASDIHSEVTRLHNSFATGQAIKQGIPVAIVGPTNAGKSSLLNALTGDDTAIVSDIHGTTRDVIEDTITIGDYNFRLMDTAGLRPTTDTIERIGIQRALDSIAKARIALIVLDPADTASLPELLEATDAVPHRIIALNKADIHPGAEIAGLDTIAISATNGDGIENLRKALTDAADSDTDIAADNILVTNARHAAQLKLASDDTRRIIDALDSGLSGDLIAIDVRQTIHHLGAITGTITTTDILTTIFSRFCIGK